MSSYERYAKTASHLRAAIVDDSLRQIALRLFEQERGHRFRATLPDKSDPLVIEQHGFSCSLDPDRQAFENQLYNGTGITTNRLAATPELFEGIAESLCSFWWDTFGEHHRASDHPGEPTMDEETLRNALKQLTQQRAALAADPVLDDLIGAVEDKNYRLAAQFLNVDDEQTLPTPGGGHELSALFTNGDISVVYRDRDIALLKPEYNHDIREEVMNDQRPVWQQVRITGEMPEEAFVVGRDDTPTGLFAHSVDGTRLDVEQDVSCSYLYDVMGFDTNYEHDTDVLDIDRNTRVRIQGDFAVRRVGDAEVDEATRCNLPVDNHLCIINSATVPDGESRAQEPVTVDVPRLTPLNVVHDEHDNVTVDLPAGRYEFYLLQRGLQLAEERPDWPSH